MTQRWLTLLILSGLISLVLGISVSTAADNSQNMADLQKALNAEVLAQPFSVPKPTQVKPQPTPATPPSKPVRHYHRSYWRPYHHHLGLGWHIGHRHRRHGIYHRYYGHY